MMLKRYVGPNFPWQIYRKFVFVQLALSFVFLVFAFEIAIVVWFLLQLLSWLFLLAPLGRILTDPQAKNEEPDEWFEVQELLRREDRDEPESVQNEFFESSLHAIHDPVLVIDSARNLKFWNKALLELAQLTSLKGLHLEEVFRDPDVLKLFHAALQTGESQRQNFPFRLKTNVTRYFVLTAVPQKSRTTGKILGVVGTFHDTSDIQKTEIMRIEFVANVSHELRTPLTSLKGYAQAIQDESNPEALKKYAQIISRSVDRLIHLVDDLLDLSYLESGVKLNLEVCDTKEVTESILQQVEAARAAKKQNIKTVFGAGQVRADRNRIEQVLLNLVQNAIKYIPEGANVEIRWSQSESEVLLDVSDSGPGIDDEHLPRLFERFYRADKARSPDKGGTGLGLAIVKHIMQRHGGSVSVSSRLGEGTTFVCRFPK